VIAVARYGCRVHRFPYTESCLRKFLLPKHNMQKSIDVFALQHDKKITKSNNDK
jgi:hypothetical protein